MKFKHLLSLNKLQELVKSRVIKNFIALGLVQATNYIIPLVTIPYVIRVVGTERFGLIAFAQSIFIFLIVFTDYGFQLTSTRAISLERNDQHKLSHIFSYTLFTKILLLFVAFFILVIAVTLVDELNNERFFYLVGFTFVVGQALLPTWFFQGVEQMRYITALNIIAKLILAVLTFFIVTTPEDYVLVLPIFAAGNIVSSVLGIWLIFKRFKINFIRPKLNAIILQLKEGWHLFLSNLGVSVYMHSSIIVLGFYADTQSLGYYSVADKIVITVRSVLGVYYQAIYPQVCVIAQSSQQNLRAFFKKFFLPFSVLVLLGCVLLFAIADHIIYLFTGEYSAEMTLLLRILSFVPFIVVLNIPFNQTLLAFDYKQVYLKLIGTGSILSLLMLIVLAHFYEEYGVAIGVVLTEAFMTVGFVFMARRFLPSIRIL